MADSIFDQAGRMGGKPKKAKNLGSDSERSSPKVDPTFKSGESTDDIATMLDKMRKMRKDLESQLETIRDSAKANGINIEKYFGTTYELTKQEIEKMRDQEKVLSDKIAAAIPADSCLNRNPKSKEAMTKERKNKFRGSRQNWIPMK